MEEIIKDIKRQFRAAMNGVASASMRQNGLQYKVNFGIELPRLREIAAEYTPDHDLAQALWKENIRESKILAGILMPVERFFPEVADIWVEQMPTQEMAELTTMNLFQRLPYASTAAFRWVSRPEENFQVCGLLLLTRLCMQGREFSEQAGYELVDQAVTLLQDENPRVSQQAFLLLRKYAQMDDAPRCAVLQAVKPLKDSKVPELQGRVEQLLWECQEN